MKRKWVLLKILVGLIVLIVMLSFANNQYKNRELASLDNQIDYSEGIYFINHEVVDLVLKSTHKDYPKMQIQRISVEEMEHKLKENPYIKDAQVYVENNGALHTRIEQEVPILRVHEKQGDYYITRDENKIPTSPYFSAPVLLGRGEFTPEDYKGLVELTEKIKNDKLLKNLIIGIQKKRENSFNLVVSDGSYILTLGSLENIDKKLKNFKVFHQEYIMKTAEMPFKVLNLKYINQIVASK